MSDINHPNKRIREASKNGERHAVVATTTKSDDPKRKAAFPRPMPGIIILVHGVNDVGEAYPTQAAGLCEGLNLRLGRNDLTPGDWDVERACPNMRKATYERRAETQGYNPIIPFYWGCRPVDKATYEADQARYREELRRRGPAGAEAPYDAYYVEGRQDPKRGYQNMDCFKNRLDEHFCKGGGVFPNATTNLVDMWGPGSDLYGIVRSISTMGRDLSHPLYENPHRIYLVNAARRLANLILLIRRDTPKTKDDSINIVAHSQGTLVSMLANFFVAQATPAVRPADCLILNNSPYSLETPTLESRQSYGPQQSAHARTQTLVNFCKLMDAQKQAGPEPEELVSKGVASSSVAGKVDHLRDNHGKLFNYFCLHDKVVSLLNVQGIGWQGVPTAVADKAGAAFAQRVFVTGRAMHTPPGPYPLPDMGMPAANRDVPKGQVRNINAAPLPDLGCVFQLPAGCNTLGASDWGVYSGAAGTTGRNVTREIIKDPRPSAARLPDGMPLTRAQLAEVQQALSAEGKNWPLIQANGAGPSKLVITRYLTEQELMERARETRTEISNHSAIVLHQDVSKCVTAFDLAVGRCKSYDETQHDGGEFWQKLLRTADWRDSDVKVDQEYYNKGILPRQTKLEMNKPPAIPGIVNETTRMQGYSSELRHVDEQIARLNQEKDRWPRLEWEERMRSLQRQRRSLLPGTKAATRESHLFPAAHQP